MQLILTRGSAFFDPSQMGVVDVQGLSNNLLARRQNIFRLAARRALWLADDADNWATDGRLQWVHCSPNSAPSQRVVFLSSRKIKRDHRQI